MDEQVKVGPWRRKSRETVYDNPWISLEHHEVLAPTGNDGIYGVVRFKNRAIGVLPISEDGDVWLVGQHRYPLDRYSWELPEGGGPLTEEPLNAAKRELLEETGVRAEHWSELAVFDISNSVTDEVAVCYLAWGLTDGDTQQADPTEDLDVRKVKFKTLLEMVMNGDITDSLTIIMVLKAHALALRGDAPQPISQILAAE